MLFVYGSYEFLAMLEGKIRETPFFLRFNLEKNTLAISKFLCKENAGAILKPLLISNE